MKNNLQYLTKWCHSRGYSIKIGMNIYTVRNKNKSITQPINTLERMGVEEFRNYRIHLYVYMEGLLNEKR